MHKPISKLTGIIVTALFVCAGLAAYSQRYAISDWYYLRSYHPSTTIAALADQTAFTPRGRALFYRANPQIVTQRATMVSKCSLTDSHIAELGCYLSSDQIYLLNISEPNLKNEMATTAGYETLHSVYQRLGGGQRRSIDVAIEQVAAQITDPHILDQIQIYAQTEPGARDNELYSVLGTEYPGTLPPTLLASYNLYFANRNQLVANYQQFNQTFDGLHAQITQLGSQIEATKTTMNHYLAANQIEAYNNLVPGVNQQINTYNNDIQLYNQYGKDILGEEPSANPE